MEFLITSTLLNKVYPTSLSRSNYTIPTSYLNSLHSSLGTFIDLSLVRSVFLLGPFPGFYSHVDGSSFSVFL